MRKVSMDKHQLMGKASTDKDLSMDMLNIKLSIDINRSIRRQNDIESNVHSGADMAAESKFVDPGGFLENGSIIDIETILRIHIKDSICLSSNGQATIKCENRWPIIISEIIR